MSPENEREEEEQELTEEERERRAGEEALTNKEKEVVELVAQGKTNEEIAQELRIAISTVKSHVSNMLRKTGCKNRTQLADLWRGRG